MIRLHNVSTQPLIGIRGDKKSHMLCKRNFKLIKKLDLIDFQKLSDYYKEQERLLLTGENDLSFDDDLGFIIQRTEELIDETNKRNARIKPEVFETHDALMIGDEIVFIRDVDKSVGPEVLLYGSPLDHYEDTKAKIGYMSKKFYFGTKDMATLKDLLSHCTVSGKNAYSMHCSFVPEAVLRAINMYEDQIARQIKSTGKSIDEIDLKSIFKLNKEKKIALVSEQYDDVAEYLSNQAVYVWGERPFFGLKDGERYPEPELIYRSYKQNNYDSKLNRELLTNAIANYVSLQEAENGLLTEIGPQKAKVIDRFVSCRH